VVVRRRTLRLPGLDGIRALAVIAVLAYHDGHLRGGFLGVSIFFTLSGYLITRLLIVEREESGRVSLSAFFARRLRRLLPAALGGVVLATLVSLLVTDARAGVRGDGLAAIANVANWRFVFDGRSYADMFAAPSPLAHFWSLAVEEQFYLLLAPLLAMLLARRSRSRTPLAIGVVVLTAGSFVAGWLMVDYVGLDRAYYGTDTRALEFLVGALLAVAITGRAIRQVTSRVFAGAAVLAALLLGWAEITWRESDPRLFHGGLLIHALLVCVVLVGVTEPGPLRAVCSFRPLVALGVISYGVYVFHWPVFLLLDERRTGLDAGAVTAVRVAATLAIAAASYLAIEQPIRARRRIRRAAWLVAPAGIALVVTAVIAVSSTAPRPTVVFKPAFVGASALRAPPRPPVGTSAPVGASAPAATVARPGVVLIVGDSVALTLGRGIERYGAAHGVIVDNEARLGCTVLVGVQLRGGYFGTTDRGPDPCGSLVRFPALVQQVSPDVVVMLYGAWDVYDASWDGGKTWFEPGSSEWNAHYKAAIAQTASMLSATGARLLWLTPPCFAPPPGSNRGGDGFDPARVAILGHLADDVAARNGMTVSHELTRTGCPVDFDARPDGVHYGDPAADAATALIAPELERLLAMKR
jgi:peptidoglycan/LPS O-acetylase OafA/YrhL